MYFNKAQGAFVRSRAKWLEEGEKNSSYFSKLEKSRQVRNAVNALSIKDKIVNDQKEIANEIHMYYQNLYLSSFLETNCNNFFRKLQPYIPQIDSVFKQTCESDLSIKKLDEALKRMTLGKSPVV